MKDSDQFAFGDSDHGKVDDRNRYVEPSNATLSTNDGDQAFNDTQSINVAPLVDPTSSGSVGQRTNDIQMVVAQLPDGPSSVSDGDHRPHDTQVFGVVVLTETNPFGGVSQLTVDTQTQHAQLPDRPSSISVNDQSVRDIHAEAVVSLIETNPFGGAGHLKRDTHSDVAQLLDGPSSVSGSDHSKYDILVGGVAALTETNPSGSMGQRSHDAQTGATQLPDGLRSVSDSDHPQPDIHQGDVAALTETIGLIRAAHRERCMWMELRMSSNARLGSWLRSSLGWSHDKSASERAAIRAQAKAIVEAAEFHVKACRKVLSKPQEIRPPLPEVPEILEPWAMVIVPHIEAREHVDEREAKMKRAMENLAATLPVDPAWMESAKGFGFLGLAIIVGEAGDLSNYPNPAKLWMRMGAGILDGRRQGAPGPNAKKSDWLKEKYSPARHSRLVTIGEAFVKCEGSPYRDLYLTRKVYEVAQAEAAGLIVAPSAKIPDKRKHEYRSLGHIHNRARRYAEKRLLLHLWRAWKRTVPASATP